MEPKQRNEIDLFKVAGVQIAIDYSWLIIFVLVLWSSQRDTSRRSTRAIRLLNTGWSAWSRRFCFFVSIVIHELSHAIVANRLGQPVERISLFIFGGNGSSRSRAQPVRGRTQNRRGGPLTSFVLGAIFMAIPHALHLYGSFPDVGLCCSITCFSWFHHFALGCSICLPGISARRRSPSCGRRSGRALGGFPSGDRGGASGWGRGIAYGLDFSLGRSKSSRVR